MANISKIKVNNVVYDIKDAQARANIAALIGSGDAAGAIDNLNEIIAFLDGIDTDDPTLSNQLLAINTNKANKSETVSDITYNSSNRQLSKTINGTTTLVVTIPEGVTVDSTWVANSTNPAQSKLVKTALDGKVDTVSGKGLSTNDYTTDEKNKLAGIAAGAEVNVQSDWNATSGDAVILNKPTIPTVPSNVSSFTNDSGYQTAANVSASLADVYDGYDSTTETLSFTFPTT